MCDILGFGGGYMERDEVVEYVKRDDSDDDYDLVINPHFLFLIT